MVKFTLPGSNYCGPGGSGQVLHPTDQLCKNHDKFYKYKHYFYNNDYDKQFLSSLNKRNPKGFYENLAHSFASSYFNSKSKIMPNWLSKKRSRHGHHAFRDTYQPNPQARASKQLVTASRVTTTAGTSKNTVSIKEHGYTKRPRISLNSLAVQANPPLKLSQLSYGVFAGGPRYAGNMSATDAEGDPILDIMGSWHGIPIAYKDHNDHFKCHGTGGRQLFVNLNSNPDVQTYIHNSEPLAKQLLWGRDMVPTFSFVHGAVYDPSTTTVKLGGSLPTRMCTTLTMFELFLKLQDHLGTRSPAWTAADINRLTEMATVDKTGTSFHNVVDSNNLDNIQQYMHNDKEQPNFFTDYNFYYNGGHTKHEFVNMNNYTVTLLVAECIPRHCIHEKMYTTRAPTGHTGESLLDGTKMSIHPLDSSPLLPQDFAIYDSFKKARNHNIIAPHNNLSIEAYKSRIEYMPSSVGGANKYTDASFGYTNIWKPYSSTYVGQNKAYYISKKRVKLDPGQKFNYTVSHKPYSLRGDTWYKYANAFMTSDPLAPNTAANPDVTVHQNLPIFTPFATKILEVTVYAEDGIVSHDANSLKYDSIDSAGGSLTHTQAEYHDFNFKKALAPNTYIKINNLDESTDWVLEGLRPAIDEEKLETQIVNEGDIKVEGADDAN
jgi:hypothetical protein